MGLNEFFGSLVLCMPGDNYFKDLDADPGRYNEDLHRFFHPPFDQEEEEWVVDRRKADHPS